MVDKIDAAGLALVKELLSPEAAEAMLNPPEGSFAPEYGQLAINNAFGAHWARPGLSHRDRSLITVAMLVAIRANHELQYHLPLAIKNGVTREELEELIYHSSAYLGFPAGASARQLASEIFDKQPTQDYDDTI